MYKNAFVYNERFLLELVTGDPGAQQQQTPRTFRKAIGGSIGITHLGVRVEDLDSATDRMTHIPPLD
jgi:hypothetical protein